MKKEITKERKEKKKGKKESKKRKEKKKKHIYNIIYFKKGKKCVVKFWFSPWGPKKCCSCHMGVPLEFWQGVTC